MNKIYKDKYEVMDDALVRLRSAGRITTRYKHLIKYCQELETCGVVVYSHGRYPDPETYVLNA